MTTTGTARIRRTSALLAALALATSQAFAQGFSDDVIKIGVLTDMNGPNSDFAGRGSFEAARLAVEDIGGSIAGKRIEVIQSDHQNKADIASATARRWFDNEQVDMITDMVSSPVSLAVVEIGKQKKRVTMVTGGYSSRLTNDDCSPYAVHHQVDTIALSSTPRLLTKRGADTWFFVTADYAFGRSMEKDATAAIEEAKGRVLGSVKHPFNNTDFSSFMLQAQASGAKMVALANAGGDMINSVKAANEFGLTKSDKQSVMAMAFLITDVHALGLDVAQGLYTIEGFYWDADAETRRFAERFFKRMNKMPSAIQAATYSATLTWLKAVRAAGTDDATVVMARMKADPVDDMYARNARIREDGRLMKDLFLVQVKKPGESKRPWDYYHVRSTVPADEAFQPLSKSTCALVKKN